MYTPQNPRTIFGAVHNGVPSPLAPITHGWPTRFHGPVFTVPGSTMSYEPRKWTVVPFLGFGEVEPAVRKSLGVALVAGAVGYVVGTSTGPRRKPLDGAVVAVLFAVGAGVFARKVLFAEGGQA